MLFYSEVLTIFGYNKSVQKSENGEHYPLFFANFVGAGSSKSHQILWGYWNCFVNLVSDSRNKLHSDGSCIILEKPLVERGQF